MLARPRTFEEEKKQAERPCQFHGKVKRTPYSGWSHGLIEWQCPRCEDTKAAIYLMEAAMSQVRIDEAMAWLGSSMRHLFREIREDSCKTYAIGGEDLDLIYERFPTRLAALRESMKAST